MRVSVYTREWPILPGRKHSKKAFVKRLGKREKVGKYLLCMKSCDDPRLSSGLFLQYYSNDSKT